MDQPPESNPHHRRSIRLPGYDYSCEGSYFVTIVTHEREPLFGEIINYEMKLSAAGKIAWDVCNSLHLRYPQIEINYAVVMPNHFHAIIDIVNPPVGAIHELPLQVELPLPPVGAVHEPPEKQPPEKQPSRRRMLLPLVVGFFKMNTAKQINHLLDTPGNPVWQRNYYDHIITTEHEYDNIANYIVDNPQNWQTDSENCEFTPLM